MSLPVLSSLTVSTMATPRPMGPPRMALPIILDAGLISSPARAFADRVAERIKAICQDWNVPADSSAVRGDVTGDVTTGNQ